ncbi:uncharacterized protein LOC131009301 [Salvia miltiorrhiza]|uniref:uncharacterized protein LOC131009301 n=1 Tax=Salvia miltiorrhiza TaxID=226208 RepID=UPI0025AD3057|nr:uncharacterized protein LOC131009301 [Salvia miltiorrhiza]
MIFCFLNNLVAKFGPTIQINASHRGGGNLVISAMKEGRFDCKLNLSYFFLPSFFASSLSFLSHIYLLHIYISLLFQLQNLLSFSSSSDSDFDLSFLRQRVFRFDFGHFCFRIGDFRFISSKKKNSKKIGMKKACELCKQAARICCESDQASLCWDCDAKVHSANFLVARHSRNLLCRVCQSPTSWSAAGSKLEPTYSACRKCARKTVCDGEDEEEEKAVEEEEEMAENHVVPWSPPPDSSLSGGEAVVHGGEAAVVRKRGRSDRPIIDDLNICTPSSEAAASVADSVSRGESTPQRKFRRTDGGEAEARVPKSPIVAAVKRFRREEAVPCEEMPRAVDLNLTLTLGLFSR